MNKDVDTDLDKIQASGKIAKSIRNESISYSTKQDAW